MSVAASGPSAAVDPGRRKVAVAVGGTLLAAVLAVQLPATRRPILDPAATRHLPPGSSRIAIALDDGRWLVAERLLESPGGDVEIVRLGAARRLAPAELDPSRSPVELHFLLGTDRLGRDLAARLPAALARSLSTALLAAIAAVAIGTAYGGAAAWSGGRPERILVRGIDLWTALPKLFLVLAVAATVRPAGLALPLLLAAISWTPAARIVRHETRRLLTQTYVEAAVAIGAAPAAVARRHLLPELAPLLGSLVALLVGELVLLEASLSFLGAGHPPSAPSLGTLLQEAAEGATTRWWSIAFPGLLVTAVTFGALRIANAATALRESGLR